MPSTARHHRWPTDHAQIRAYCRYGYALVIFLIVDLLPGITLADESPEPVRWNLRLPLLSGGSRGDFDEAAVKDPSLVFYDGFWHLFFTARGRGEYTTGYVRGHTLADLRRAKRYRLPTVRGKARYGCAPQIFYFAPQKTWYLIFQNRDSNYQSAYVTNRDIFDPIGWSEAKNLLRKDSGHKWIDFWVICDKKYAYLFYTQAHSTVMVRRTALALFPGGWGPAREVLSGVHEAVHIYKVAGQQKYDMIFERNTGEGRSFGLARADSLEGPWKKVTDAFATGSQLVYRGQGKPWTEMVSHGEAIRSGYDQHLQYNPTDGRWLIQGLRHADATAPYPALRWQLGIIERDDQPPTE